MNKSITLITAFFDIGRGNWNAKSGRSDRLERTAETYFNYFNKLSSIDNKIIVFTSPDLKEQILKIREGKPTHVITLDLHHKFKYTINKISAIQHSDSFKKLIKPEQLKNPEYWSAEYVLINNLKPYFVNTAINLGLADSELISWVDFGYVRKDKVLYGIKEWNHPFDKNYVHLFSIQDGLNLEDEQSVMDKVINNETYIIGGVIVAAKDKWIEFYKLVTQIQKKLLLSGIIDDDQGIFLICASKHPDLFKLNYLGYMKWFSVFKLFHQKSKVNYFTRLAILLRIIK
ncbi:MAG TPA: protein YibB [Providencia sp.]|uniref:protein YibB n=1 Tax=Providencia sp. TaxID=589 RepID=UPI000E8CC4E6|nr:protein YibB [Providencia sp.]MBP6083047.1 protein YibB [Providencia sp.]HBO24725.1 protein YibB [Providencia sp.]